MTKRNHLPPRRTRRVLAPIGALGLAAVLALAGCGGGDSATADEDRSAGSSSEERNGNGRNPDRVQPFDPSEIEAYLNCLEDNGVDVPEPDVTLPEGATPPEGFELPEDFELPEGFEPGDELPEDFELPDGFEPPEGVEPPQDGDGFLGQLDESDPTVAAALERCEPLAPEMPVADPEAGSAQ